jgi:ABC-type sugar transport system ATPase subunit
MTAPLLRVDDLTVRYGATVALDGVSLDLAPGEVHAIVGENGAGKSTLLRAVAGAARAAGGRIELGDRAHLEWVPQETVLPPDLTAAEWVFLGRERRGRLGWLQRRRMDEGTATALRALECAVAPRTRLGSLPPPQRKQVQLARALRTQPQVLLLDEPTAVLGEAGAQALFTAVRALRAAGTGVWYVSHRLAEVLAIADRVTVLRDGRRVSTDPVSAVSEALLVERLVGRPVVPSCRGARGRGEPALRLHDVATGPVRDFSLTVRYGEIVGLAGLVGAGRSEVLEAAAGLRPVTTGHIERTETPRLMPEDRATKGLVPTLDLRENLFLPAANWWLRPARERMAAREWVERLGIRASSVDAPIDSLSGGNQQKLLLARALRHQSKLLLLDEPTAGIDVGAKADIHTFIQQLADGDTAVLLASSDLPELLHLCDRVVALRNGQNVGVGPARFTTEARLAALITGAEEQCS